MSDSESPEKGQRKNKGQEMKLALSLCPILTSSNVELPELQLGRQSVALTQRSFCAIWGRKISAWEHGAWDGGEIKERGEGYGCEGKSSCPR